MLMRSAKGRNTPSAGLSMHKLTWRQIIGRRVRTYVPLPLEVRPRDLRTAAELRHRRRIRQQQQLPLLRSGRCAQVLRSTPCQLGGQRRRRRARGCDRLLLLRRRRGCGRWRRHRRRRRQRTGKRGLQRPASKTHFNRESCMARMAAPDPVDTCKGSVTCTVLIVHCDTTACYCQSS